ncbi:hypothetical protein Droror1_Dr00004421 [Drosera rotundifolia]
MQTEGVGVCGGDGGERRREQEEDKEKRARRLKAERTTTTTTNPGKNKRSKFPSDLVTPNGLDNPLEKELITEEWTQNKRSEHSEGLANRNGNRKPVEKGSVSNRLADCSHSSGSIVRESHTHLEEPLMVVAQGSKWNKNSKKSDIVCAVDYCDESYLILNKDVSFMGQDSRISAFDLLEFEMSDRKCPLQANCVLEGNRRPFDDSLARAQTDASLDGSEETGGEDKDDEMMDVTTTDDNIGSNAGTSLDSQNNYSVDKAIYRIVKELVACADFPPPLAVEVPCLVTTENETYL